MNDERTRRQFFSVVVLDINFFHSNLIPGQFEHILHAERVGIIGNDLINANSYFQSMHFSLSFHWPRVTTNCLDMRVLLKIIFCSCVIETMLSYENGGSVPRAVRD